MFLQKSKKYKLDYTPNLMIPQGLTAYVRMVVARNPLMWFVFIFTDIVHGIRYPLAFLLVGRIIDLLTGLSEGAEIPEAVWNYSLWIFIILLIGELAHALPHYWTFDWWKRARAELRSDMMAYTLNHSYTYFQDHFAGSLARKVSEGIEKALLINEQFRWNILLPLVSMCTSGVVLFSYAPHYGALVAVFLVLILGPVFLKMRKLREKSRIFADSCSAVSGQIVDTLSNIAAVKSYAREAQEMDEHTRVSEDQMKAWHKMLRAFLMLDNYRRATFVVFGPGMMVLCVHGWQTGLISLGDIATIMGVSFSFTGNAWHLSGGIIRISESLGYMNDSLTTLIKPHSIQDKEGAAELKVSAGKIVFEKVGFEYESQQVFSGLNIQIEPKQRIGLIGPSGAGKSTFINLIQRFFDVQAGGVYIDGQNIADVTQNSLRSQIAVIPQDTSMFHRSIMENIRYGRLEAPDEEVIEAARKAHALGFIEKLPQGFDTLVGERGVKLSGGQRQRIAIARAILKTPPF